MADNPHIGSSFDDFLADEGTLGEIEAVAAKRVIAWQIAEQMKPHQDGASGMDGHQSARIGSPPRSNE